MNNSEFGILDSNGRPLRGHKDGKTGHVQKIKKKTKAIAATIVAVLALTAGVLVNIERIVAFLWSNSLPSVFNVIISQGSIRAKFPTGLLLKYDHPQLGRCVAPIPFMFYLEIANVSDKIARVYSMETQALMKFDKGGDLQYVNRTLTYKPSGKVVREWRPLFSVGPHYIQDGYLPMNGNYEKCQHVDVTDNLESAFTQKQLQPGESISGWMFYEVEPDLRGQLLDVDKFKFTIKSSSGHEDVLVVKQIKMNPAINPTDVASLRFLGGYHNLLSEKLTVCPVIDIVPALEARRTGKESENGFTVFSLERIPE